jgi:hypothetical protein
LMKSGDAEVRAAATDTVTNLVLRFSPMRDVSYWVSFVLKDIVNGYLPGIVEFGCCLAAMSTCTFSRLKNANVRSLGAEAYY